MDRNELIAEIKAQLQEELKVYKASLADIIPQEQKDQAREAKDAATHFVQENPLMSVGLAAFAGFVIARFFYRGER